MRIALACDHGGYPLKMLVSAAVHADGHEVIDFGTDNGEISVDFPDYVLRLVMLFKEVLQTVVL